MHTRRRPSSTIPAEGISPAGFAADLLGDPLSTMLTAHTEAVEPVSVTLWQLRRWPLQIDGRPAVDVFENPSIIAEATRREWRGPPLVCSSSGWPNVALLMLLRQARASGATVLLHADLDHDDPAGVAHLVNRVGGRSWMPYAARSPPSRPRRRTSLWARDAQDLQARLILRISRCNRRRTDPGPTGGTYQT